MFEVKVPATSANLGCGFDSLGVALNLYNRFVFKKTDKKIDINIKESNKVLNLPLEKNLIYIALKKLYNMVNKKLEGLKVVEYSNIPLARGLGSSATAIIGSLVGGNEILNNPLTDQEILDLALQIEDHPDNIVPAFTGGLVINIINNHKIEYKKIKVEGDLKIVLIIPDFELKTSNLRKVLPAEVKLQDAVFNHSRTALLTSVFINQEWERLSLAMEDRLHQNYRAKLIPGFKEVLTRGYESGALGIALSGAGPTVIAFCKEKEKYIGKEMVQTFRAHGINSRYLITEFNNRGAEIRKERFL
ncbi:MAG: homoserine kinase [Bacillota bacterium]